MLTGELADEWAKRMVEKMAATKELLWDRQLVDLMVLLTADLMVAWRVERSAVPKVPQMVAWKVGKMVAWWVVLLE